MMKLNALCQQGNRRQAGAAAVEFALVVVILLVLLLGIIELGRFFYLFNSVQEVTRRAAREAVVSCTDNITQGNIQNEAVLGTGSLPAGSEVTYAKVVIDYLDKDQEPINNPPSTCNNILECVADAPDCIKFVRVRVCNLGSGNGGSCTPVQYEPMIGLFVPNGLTNMQTINLGIDIPGSTVIMPAESMGYAF